jgi:ketosteroid isomerase-like protein
MSEENVELVREAIETWNRDGVEAVTAYANPEAVFYAFPEWPDDRVYRGRDGWRKLMTQFVETFDEIRWEIAELIETGNRVVALVRQHAKIKGTGVPLEQSIGVVVADFGGDQSFGEVHFFLTWAEARQAAGLSE